MNGTELVVSWSYDLHIGVLMVTKTRVDYRTDDSTVFIPLPSSHTSGSGSGSGSGGVVPSDTSISFPLPVAGVNYSFRVTASNEAGSTTALCPNIFLTIGKAQQYCL